MSIAKTNTRFIDPPLIPIADSQNSSRRSITAATQTDLRCCRLFSSPARPWLACVMLVAPSRDGVLPPLMRRGAALLDHVPCAASDDVLHASLLAHDHGQSLRPGLPWEEPPGVGVESLVHNPLPIPLVFHFPQRRLGVVWVRARGHDAAVVEHLSSGLP